MQMCILRENVEREAGIGAKYHKALGFANASKKLGELKSDRSKRSRCACVCVPVADSALGRLNAIVDYLKEETGEGFDDFVKSLLRHPAVAAAGDHVVHKTPEEVALLVIGASFTHEQFDHLCKAGGFVDPRYRSSYHLTAGFNKVEKRLPSIRSTFF